MKKNTASNYRARLTRVMDYIYQNLDRALGVNELAEVAHMSPYHFHRIYRELAQETISTTVRRLRLQRAAAELIRSDHPIASIANKVAYGSQEAFTRAFTQQFGETPGEYRQTRQAMEMPESIPFVAMLPNQNKEYQHMFTVEINEFAETPLVGYEHQGDYLEIGQVFEKLFINAASQGLLDDKTRSIGLYYHDPKTVEKEDLRSMACITLPAGKQFTDDENTAQQQKIPAGRCASLVFKGSYAELQKPYDWFFGKWLPESGYEAADFPVFEEYLNDPKETPPNELLTRINCLLA